MGSCLVGLGAGNLQVILQSCAPPNEVGLWTGIENFIGNLAGMSDVQCRSAIRDLLTSGFARRVYGSPRIELADPERAA